jgi:hypothetical protein
MYVVNVNWLWDSIFRWERQDEMVYGIPGIAVILGEPPVIRIYSSFILHIPQSF